MNRISRCTSRMCSRPGGRPVAALGGLARGVLVAGPAADPLVAAAAERPAAVLGRRPVAGEQHGADVGGHPGMVQRRGRARRRCAAGTRCAPRAGRKRPGRPGRHGPVIGDVGEVKAIHRMPQVRSERASHALKLRPPLLCDRSRIPGRSSRCASNHKESEGAGHPATPRGPPIDQHPPRSTPLTRPSQRREIDWIPPTAGLSPSDPPHIS